MPTVQPTFDQITEIFGITSPGFYDNSSSVFLLHFPGLLFTFSIDYRVEPKITHGIQSLHFPSGKAPVVSKISIYTGSRTPNTAIAPEIPSICLNKDIFGSKLKVISSSPNDDLVHRFKKIYNGVNLTVFTQGTYQLDREITNFDILFDHSCQDVMSMIGTPTSVYYKSEEIMKQIKNDSIIMSQSNLSQQNDYFFNYVTLGIDILFSGETNRVQKFILHSNFPCCYNFNSYFMCNFEIPIDTTQAKSNCKQYLTPATTVMLHGSII
jgi:hypothetical protein